MENNDIRSVELEEQKEKGASMLEYAMLAALIAVVCIAAITTLGTNVSQTFSDVSDQLGAGT